MKIYFKSILSVALCVIPLMFFNCISNGSNEDSDTNSDNIKKEPLELEFYNGGKFTIKIPKGWEIEYSGDCTTFSFVVYDPKDRNNMISYVGEIGVVYLSQHAKQFDYEKIYYWGMNVEFFEMPIICPFNPQSFVLSIPQICQTNYKSYLKDYFPDMNNLQIISAKTLQPVIYNSSFQEMRIVFQDRNKAYDGIIGTSTWCFDESYGAGLSTYCVSYDSEKFVECAPYLMEVLNSFKFEKSYFNNCMSMINARNQVIANSPGTIDEISDGMDQRWSSRDESDDIIAAKRSDAMLNYERLYDPETGDVYRVNQDFYDSYIRNENNYQLNNLKPIPSNNHDLWTKPTLNERDIR